MKAGTQHTEEAKLEQKRARGRYWRKNRDHHVLAEMRKAEQAAQPPRKQPAKRLCLACARPFDSAWCGNRLCAKCRDDLPVGVIAV